MGIQFEQALGLHADALRLRAERSKVLASNIANVSTPGFQARDMDFRASMEQLASGDEDGMLALSDGAALGYRRPNQPSQDGNTVELGVEQAAFSQNTADFQTSLAFLNMKLKGLAKAINGTS
ncbi:flagellar basal body rod protein FlgB [Vogesella facilis]|uniref:Flagellar basal body rod protein FlgB n=1 Tax=Vogesella facilis TaxID=1655232 RepID=A0ABV7RIL6_9NEIS